MSYNPHNHNNDRKQKEDGDRPALRPALRSMFPALNETFPAGIGRSSSAEEDDLALALAISLTSAAPSNTRAPSTSSAATFSPAATTIGSSAPKGSSALKETKTRREESTVATKSAPPPTAAAVTRAPQTMVEMNQLLDMVIHHKVLLLTALKVKFKQNKRIFVKSYLIALREDLTPVVAQYALECKPHKDTINLINQLEVSIKNKVAELKKYLAESRPDIKVVLSEETDLMLKMTELRSMMKEADEIIFLDALSNVLTAKKALDDSIPPSLKLLKQKIERLKRLIQIIEKDQEGESFKEVFQYFLESKREFDARLQSSVGITATDATALTTFGSHSTSLLMLQEAQNQIKQTLGYIKRFREARALGAQAEEIEKKEKAKPANPSAAHAPTFPTPSPISAVNATAAAVGTAAASPAATPADATANKSPMRLN